jgi:acetyl-CoA synthetase
MSQTVYPVPESFAAGAQISRADYDRLYEESVQDSEAFWARTAQRIAWIREPHNIKDVSCAERDFRIRWFADGKLNVASNCLDRHLENRGDKTAIIWEGDDPKEHQFISYRKLHECVCQCANALQSVGIMAGDRVTIYLPMIPELPITMLACARIGAVHSVVFGGSPPKLWAVASPIATPNWS